MSVPLAYLGIVVIWSTTPLAIKWSGEEIGFLLGISARVLLAASICLSIYAVMRWRLPRDKQAIHSYLAVGVPGSIALCMVYFGSQYISSGLVSVMFGLTPIFTGLFAAIWLKENVLTVPRIVGVVMGILGLFLIFHNSMSVGLSAAMGIALVFAATVVHSFGTVWQKHAVKQVSPFEANTGGVCVAALLVGSVYLVFGGPIPTQVPDYVVLSIVYLAIAGSIVGAVLFYYALRRVEATTMAMLTLITPVCALFIGKWFNHEEIDSYTVAGTVCILLGLVMYQWAARLRQLIWSRVGQKNTAA